MSHEHRRDALFLDHKTCLLAVEKALHDLVKNCGTKGTCKGCHAEVYWIIHANGKTVPYTPAGLNHFIDCPNAKDFKR